MNRAILLWGLLPLWLSGCVTLGGQTTAPDPLVPAAPSSALPPTQPRVAWSVADALWGQRVQVEVPRRNPGGGVYRYPVTFNPGEVLARALRDAAKGQGVYYYPRASMAEPHDVLIVLENIEMRARPGQQWGSTCRFTLTWRAQARGGRVAGPRTAHGEAAMICDTQDFTNGDAVAGLLTLGLAASLDVGQGYVKGLPKTLAPSLAGLVGDWRAPGAVIDWMTEDASTPLDALERGQQLQSQSNDRQAYFYFERALRLDPAYQPALVFKGIALIRLGLPAEAAAALRQAQQCDPGTEDAHIAQAWLDTLAR